MHNTLPEECLLLLIQFIALDPPSLHSLLLVNKTFFRLVAPILYRNPLNYLELNPHSKKRNLLPARILHLLLSCVPDTLKEMPYYSSYPSCILPKPSVDYLTYYTFHSDKLLYNIDYNSLRPIPSPKRHQTALSPSIGQDKETVQTTKDHPDIELPINSNEPHHHLHDSKNMEPGSCSNSSGRNMNSIVKRQATILQLKSKIHLGLVDHSPQNISTIAFVIHNIHILQHVANRLSGLVRLELTKDSKKPDLNFALQFISTHKSHFSTLNEIKIMAQNISDKSDLSSLVHAMGEPRVIDVSRWINGNEYLSKFPLQVCRVLLMGLSTSSSILGLEPNFLAKLSKLHTLRIFAFHQDMFANTPDLESVNHTTHSHPEESSLHQIPSRQMQLPNRGVISVCLNGPDENLVPALKDACDTSRWTLKRLSGTSNFIGISNPPLSWTWLMPCLTYLELEGTIAVNFNLDSLVQCPQLYELILNIGRQIPQTWDVVSKAAQLAKVSSRLRLLDLSGWWALPDSALLGILFPVLTRLKKLDLMFCTGPSCGCILELLPKLSALEWFGVPEHYTESEYNEIKSLKESLNLSIEIETLGKK